MLPERKPTTSRAKRRSSRTSGGQEPGAALAENFPCWCTAQWLLAMNWPIRQPACMRAYTPDDRVPAPGTSQPQPAGSWRSTCSQLHSSLHGLQMPLIPQWSRPTRREIRRCNRGSGRIQPATSRATHKSGIADGTNQPRQCGAPGRTDRHPAVWCSSGATWSGHHSQILPAIIERAIRAGA